MALVNFGIVPGGAVGTELQAVTRRAAMPAVVVQLGKATPTLSAMLAAAEPVKGGVSPVTIPVQGTRMVTGQFVDYSGAGSAPTVAPGLMNAEYNLKAFTTWIPYYLFEGLIQQDAELVPIIWARMNDAGNVASDTLATKLMAPLSANTGLEPFSLPDVFAATDPTQGALGNIPVSNAWWKGNNAAISTLNVGGTALTTITRAGVLASLHWAQKGSGGEPPSCGLMSPGAFMALAADVIGAERYNITPEGSYGEVGEGPTIAFPALRIGGVSIYSDVYWPDNTTIAWPNYNYLQYKIHQDAAFTVIGPESLLPQYQLGYVMVMLCLLETVCSKRNAQSLMTGWTGALSI
jgi:hypothetical protein